MDYQAGDKKLSFWDVPDFLPLAPITIRRSDETI
jgi:hypothetical protein